jgi:chromosome segregation ATPase
MQGVEERIAKVEGILEEVRARLNHVEDRLNIIETRLDNIMASKADKWEIRIWFLIIVILMSVYQFLG